MTNLFLSLVSLGLLVAVLAIVLMNILRRRWDALSWRNLFLLGFAEFIALSSFWVSRGVITPGVPVDGRGMTMLAWANLLFFALFLPATWRGRRGRFIPRLLPRLSLPVTTPGIIATIVVLLAVSLVATTVIGAGYAAALMHFFRSAPPAAAVALATYYLVSRRFNPTAWALFLSTILIASLVAMVGTVSRRPLLGVFLAIPWMWYWGIWRYRSPSVNVVRLSAALSLVILVLIAYAPFRFMGVQRFGAGATIERRAQQFLELTRDPWRRVTDEIIANYLYNDASVLALYVVEHYPSSYPYTPLHTAAWMLANPVPRAWWPDKPKALGILIKERLGTEANLSAGIVAHGWAEGGLLGVAAFAVFFGLVAGWFDRALADRADNPYFIAMIGGTLGNVLGLARGDVALFFLEILVGMAVVALIMWGINLVFGPVVRAFPPLFPSLWHQADSDAGNPEPDPWSNPDDDAGAAAQAASDAPEQWGPVPGRGVNL